jgi:hypothetical protein
MSRNHYSVIHFISGGYAKVPFLYTNRDIVTIPKELYKTNVKTASIKK